MPDPGEINEARLWKRIEDLSRFTDPEKPWTRRAFSPLFMEGRSWLEEQFREAGMEVKIDAGGNLIGRLSGSLPGAKPIVTGSHSDTVPSGGRFDGILGVLAGIEIANCLTEAGKTPRHPIEVVDFLSEEPSDFGLSCVGSRVFVGQLDAEMLTRTRPDGMTLAEGIQFVGGRPDDIQSARRELGSVAAFLEVHIEQGPVLEERGIDIGVVTGIAGIHREKITVTGRADHSGTTPMDIRRDALVGAASLIGKVQRHAVAVNRSTPMVATIGKLDVFPNAANAVPETVEMVLEVRSGDNETLQSFVDFAIESVCEDLAALKVSLEREAISHVKPTPCADFLQDVVEEAARDNGYSTLRLPSGAGHDGVFVARAGPVGMIFTSCKDGRSHTPVEWADPEVCAKGARTLLSAIERLDRELV